MKMCVEWWYSPTILRSALDEDEWTASCPKANLEVMGNRKIKTSFPLPEIKL
jgi:hypothetical protein